MKIRQEKQGSVRALAGVLVAAGLGFATASSDAIAQPVDLNPGQLLIVDRDTEGVPVDPNHLRGAVILVDEDTGIQTKLVADGPFLGPQDGVFRPDGVFFVVDRTAPTGVEGGAIFRVNLYTGERVLVSDQQYFRNPRTVLWDDQLGKLIVADPRSNPFGTENTGAILAVDSVTGTQQVLLTSELLSSPVGLIAEPEGTYLIVDERAGDRIGGGTTGTIYRWDITNNNLTVVSTDNFLVRPRHGEIGPDGALYVADWASDPDDLGAPPASTETGSIIRIDRVTGAQTLISAQGNFLRPFALAFGDDGLIYVADRGMNNPDPRRGLVIRVDPATGLQEVISSGQFFYQCVGLLFVPSWYPDLVLYVDPLVRGQRSTFQLDGLAADQKGYVIVSGGGLGSYYVAPLDVSLDIVPPFQVFSRTADGQGHIEFTVRVPDSINVGSPFWAQALSDDSQGPAVKSPVIERVVRAP